MTEQYEVILYNDHGLRLPNGEGFWTFTKCREGLQEAIDKAEGLVDEGHDTELISVLYRQPDGDAYDVYDVTWGGQDEDFNESMDGDFDSGMASAGFGTDEEYGYFGEDY